MNYSVYNIGMRFEVPQFIEIEDKIFGPFTWRQFLYLGGGGGMAVVLFLTMPLIIALILGVPLALLAGALAFFPVNNRPFSFFLEAMFNYFSKQRLYIWKRKTDIVYRSKKSGVGDRNPPPAAIGRNPAGKDIASLARRLELEAMQKQQQ